MGFGKGFWLGLGLGICVGTYVGTGDGVEDGGVVGKLHRKITEVSVIKREGEKGASGQNTNERNSLLPRRSV